MGRALAGLMHRGHWQHSLPARKSSGFRRLEPIRLPIRKWCRSSSTAPSPFCPAAFALTTTGWTIRRKSCSGAWETGKRCWMTSAPWASGRKARRSIGLPASLPLERRPSGYRGLECIALRRQPVSPRQSAGSAGAAYGAGACLGVCCFVGAALFRWIAARGVAAGPLHQRTDAVPAAAAAGHRPDVAGYGDFAVCYVEYLATGASGKFRALAADHAANHF